MNKKEISAKVAELLFLGTPKSKVFAQLTGQGVKDSKLAYFIASNADPALCREHERKVDAIVILMSIQSIIAALLGFVIGVKIGPNAKWIISGICALIPILFAWGFYKHRVGVYNAYILLSISQLPNSFKGFTLNPIASSVGIAISIGTLAYIWYVRGKLFPDFAFVTPKKNKGQYIFTA
jgi:hypothetical protein